MKLARYVGEGKVAILDESEPTCPDRGLLIQTEACGLCSGELMSWYMEQKVPHVIGHEVAGVVLESNDIRFPVGTRVFPHHHAPCGECDLCKTGRSVHCLQWKSTKLLPGGMAERFGVPSGNLTDTLITNTFRAVDAALIEPMACVMKALRVARNAEKPAVIGLGVMGLMHMVALKNAGFGIPIGYDLSPKRVEWAKKLGLDARHHREMQPGGHDVVYVCPGTQAAFEDGIRLCEPGASICLFSPMAPESPMIVPQEVYFRDISLVTAFSCGPEDTKAAFGFISKGLLKAEQVVSHFIGLDELPAAYLAMKRGEILKPMVIFP
jgi:L-iditol 2-dehydrogenase